MTIEEMLTSFLRRYAGQKINYWKPIKRVAADLLGHDPKYSPVHYTKRHAKEAEVSRTMSQMVREGKVIRYRDDRRRINEVRLNEAYV